MLREHSTNRPTATAIHSGNDLAEKLRILSAAARYDASCASSGSSRQGKGIGAAHKSGICHSWSADGRCISLLKVLYSNHCLFDCAYCVNRRSNDHPRASFTPRELAQLTIDFYRRNYIEGLFLSSAVFATADETMQQVLETLRLLRTEYAFHGYIHLKIIPGCSSELLTMASELADRMSANIELPTRRSLLLLAPEKKENEILQVFDQVKRQHGPQKVSAIRSRKRVINPAGMSTQMIIGATPDNDLAVLQRADQLYRQAGLKRVYYSAYIPVNHDGRLPGPGGTPPLLREHRLYQADWLLRQYRFKLEELIAPGEPYLDADLDPKAAWALRHLEHFPLDINRATKAELLRVPGVGIRSLRRIMAARRQTCLRIDDLPRLGIVMKRARYFLHDGYRLSTNVSLREEDLRQVLTADRRRQSAQLSLNFNLPVEDAVSTLHGEL